MQAALERAMAGLSGAAAACLAGSGRLAAGYRLDVAAMRLARPGSVLKPFTLLALLEFGAVTGASRHVCERRLQLAGRRIDCTHPAVHSPLDPVAALAYSCNCWFAQFAPLLNPAGFRMALERAGVGSPSGLTSTEAGGVVRQAADRVQLQLQALGESSIEVTPLSLLNAYRKLALRRRKEEPLLAPLFEGLEAATVYGTAQPAQTPGLAVAGKTGTATSRSRIWTHAWFAGFAPAAEPEIVLVVFLESGTGGSDAAPVAGDVFEAYRKARFTA